VYEKAISNTRMYRWSKSETIPSNGKSMCKAMSKAMSKVIMK
jgi:hypothetical protein